jgi:phosphoribosyl 1,2-cyclic phosphodiesterase
MALKLKFWGASGSIPAPLTSQPLEQKVLAALRLAKEKDFSDSHSLHQFLKELPFPLRGTYKGNTNCIQILNDRKEVFLCDAGTGLRAFSDSLPQSLPANTYHLFLTHLHWDHIQGFPFFRPAYQAGNKIIIHTLKHETENTLREMMKPPFFPANYDSLLADIQYDIIPDGSNFQINDLVVKTLRQEHPDHSWAFRFEVAGRAAVISTDSQHPDNAASNLAYPFIKFFETADLLVFDSQYTLDHLNEKKRTWGHSDAITAVELAASAKVKQLILTHHDPTNDDNEIHQILDIAKKHRRSLNKKNCHGHSYPTEIKLAYDGLTVDA